MYQIFKNSPLALDLLVSHLVKFAKDEGYKLISDKVLIKSPDEFIEKLMQLKLKYNEILEKSFQKDLNISLSVKKSFEEFINKSNTSPLLAKHIDHLMRKHIRGLNQEEISLKFERTLEIFKLVLDKDRFESFYRAHLNKRLLNAQSLNDDSEKLMIQKLKKECGGQYTHKMETMMKDMNVSIDLIAEFKKQKTRSAIQFEFEAKVLTSGTWSDDKSSCVIPEQLHQPINIFTEFYMKKFNCVNQNPMAERKFGRELTWKMSYGSADLISSFGDRKYEINVTGY